MSSHPAKISFQFTYNEVYHADLRRFNLLFGNFARLASRECGILRQFCGCLSISFDPALHGQAPSPLEHPAFHRFNATIEVLKIPEAKAYRQTMAMRSNTNGKGAVPTNGHTAATQALVVQAAPVARITRSWRKA